MAQDVKLASGVKTVAEMAAVSTWANLTSDGSFPSGAIHKRTWPAEPNYNETWFRYYTDTVDSLDQGLQAQGGHTAQWLFDYLTRECLKFVKDQFCPTGYAATVTLQMVDEGGTTVTQYGTLLWPTPGEHMTRAPRGWQDVILRFRGLRAAAAS